MKSKKIFIYFWKITVVVLVNILMIMIISGSYDSNDQNVENTFSQTTAEHGDGEMPLTITTAYPSHLNIAAD